MASYHTWNHSLSGRYHLFLASNEHISLERGSMTDNDFMVKTLMSLEEGRPKSSKEEKEECTIRM